MNYGLPYKGSKNKIAEEIVGLLPAAECLVDVFAGGCAVSHAALLSGKYSRVIANDINAKFPKLFKDAISGNLPDGYDRYVSREEFDAVKDEDAAAACVWSFGNNCQDYLWNEDTAGAKSLAFRLVMSDSRAERARLYREFIKYLQGKRAELKLRREKLDKTKLSIRDTKEKLRGILRAALKESGLTAAAVDKHLGTNGMAGHYFGASQWEFPTREAYGKLREILPLPEIDFFKDDLERLESLESLERLERLKSLESLESLDRLESLESLRAPARGLEVSGVDYRLLDIPRGAVVYCDPPYLGANRYNKEDFDNGAFWDWCRETSKTHLMAVSEYTAPDDFVSFWSKNKTCVLCGGKPKQTVERLFVHESQVERWKQSIPQPELLTA